MTSAWMDQPACEHPEDRLGPLPYQGRPADPDEFECLACGHWEMREPASSTPSPSSIESIANAYGVPPSILGIRDATERTMIAEGGYVVPFAFDSSVHEFSARSIADVFREIGAMITVDQDQKIIAMMTAEFSNLDKSLRRATGALKALTRVTSRRGEVVVSHETAPGSLADDVYRLEGSVPPDRRPFVSWRLSHEARRYLLAEARGGGFAYTGRGLHLVGRPVLPEAARARTIEMVVEA